MPSTELSDLLAFESAVRAGLDRFYAMPSNTAAARTRACAALRVAVGEACDELTATRRARKAAGELPGVEDDNG